MSEATNDHERVLLRDIAEPTEGAFVDGPFGSNLKSDEYVESGVRLIQLQNIGDGYWKDDNKKYITDLKFRSLTRHGAIPGDIAIAKMADPVARACIVPAGQEQYVVVADCIRLRVDQARFDPRYMVRAINSHGTRTEAERKSIGSTRIRINLGTLKTVGCLVPPLRQQQTIAEVLDTLDTTIRQTEAIIAKMKQVKQGMLHDLLTRGIDANGELRPPPSQAPHLYKDSPLGWIPREWEVRPLGQAIADAYRYPSYFGIDYVDSGVPEVRGELIEADGTLDRRTESYRYISKATAARFARVHLRQDDIVMSVRGTIGKFALVPDRLVGAVITANLLKLTPNRTVVRAEWLLRLLLSDRFQDQLDAACSATTIKTIQVPELMAIGIAVPSLSEQQVANDRLHAIDSVSAFETAALEKLRLQKSGLMDDLLTGRVRVTPLLA